MKDPQMSNFMKIRSVAVELFHADGRKDRHDEGNSHFSKFCAINIFEILRHKYFRNFAP